MRLIVVNKTIGTKSFLGGKIVVFEGSEAEVSPNDWRPLFKDTDFIAAVTGDLVSVSDGADDLSGEDAIRWVKECARTRPIVTTQFELNDKDLKICSHSVEVDPNTGEAVIEIPTPASGRFMDEGMTFFSQSEPTRTTTIEGCTPVDLPEGALYPGSPAMPAGTPLKAYHDDELPEEFHGWRIPAKEDGGNIGHITVDTMAGYGQVPGGTILRIKGKKPGPMPIGGFKGWFSANLKWGRQG